MVKQKLILFLLLVFESLVLVKLECAGKPEVSWDFSSRNATNLIPSYTLDQRFFSRIKDQNVAFVSGISGTAIHMPRSSIVLAKNLQTDDCLLDVDSCLDICISFWLKLKSWSPNGHDSILSTLPKDRSKPGIYIGRGDSENLIIYIRRLDREPSETPFPEKYVLGQWAQFQMSWSKERGETNVWINGTNLNLNTKVSDLRIGDLAFGRNNENKYELVLGEDGGSEFYIEELSVFYTRNETTIYTTTPSQQTATQSSAAIEDITTTQNGATHTNQIKTDGTSSSTASTWSNLLTTTEELESSSQGTKPEEGLTVVEIVIAVLVPILVLTAVLLLWYFCSKRKKKQSEYEGYELTGRNDSTNDSSQNEPNSIEDIQSASVEKNELLNSD